MVNTISSKLSFINLLSIENCININFNTYFIILYILASVRYSVGTP